MMYGFQRYSCPDATSRELTVAGTGLGTVLWLGVARLFVAYWLYAA